MSTSVLDIPEISQSQGSKHVTHNLGLRWLESGVRVLSRSNGGPPGSPSDGDTYIVDSATGAWDDFSAGDIAFRSNGGWYGYTPPNGMTVPVVDEDAEVRKVNGNWVALSPAETVQDIGNVSGSVAVDLRLGTYITCTLTADTTFSFTGLPASGLALGWSMEITENAGSPAALITWPVSVKGSPSTEPTPGGTDLYVFAGVGTARIIGARAVEGL
jgi:hypothetical protein